MIYVITGPTASGKSDLAIEFARAVKAEIINADAFQVYKGMDIGTNKVNVSLMREIPHHLFDIRLPDQGYDVAAYQADGRKLISELEANNKTIVITGGTGLYIRALLFDYVFHEELRGINDDYETRPTEELFDLLNSVDPETARAIHKNNRRRIIRALRIHDNTGVTKSSHLENVPPKQLYDAIFVAIDHPREELYRRADARVLNMMEFGLLEEVKGLLEKYGKDAQGLQAIGYKELVAYLLGTADLSTAISNIQLGTRHYIKRQMTFFRHQLPIKWFPNHGKALSYLLEHYRHG